MGLLFGLLLFRVLNAELLLVDFFKDDVESNRSISKVVIALSELWYDFDFLAQLEIFKLETSEKRMLLILFFEVICIIYSYLFLGDHYRVSLITDS